MSSSDVKIEKCKLLQKYTYIKTVPYIIEKAKFTLSLPSKQKKMLFCLFCRVGARFVKRDR